MGYREIYEKGLDRIRSIGMEPYLDLGAETHSQNRLNRQHLDSFVFEMRMLDSQQADTATTLFGAQLRAPIVAAAICESRILKRLAPWDPPYLEQIAAGLADAGSMMSTGMVTLEELARIVDQGAPVLHVVKPYQDDEMVLRHLERAAELGCVAVGMDVDVFFLEKAWDEVPILVDSGFRRGTDVLKALALGANGVGIATLLVVACAGGGRDGVRAMMEALYEELGRTMSITGCRSVGAIDPSILHRAELT